eukprot:4428378-Prymnesium_polylepis.1
MACCETAAPHGPPHSTRSFACRCAAANHERQGAAAAAPSSGGGPEPAAPAWLNTRCWCIARRVDPHSIPLLAHRSGVPALPTGRWAGLQRWRPLRATSSGRPRRRRPLASAPPRRRSGRCASSHRTTARCGSSSQRARASRRIGAAR